jgi:hypothetical protein
MRLRIPIPKWDLRGVRFKGGALGGGEGDRILFGAKGRLLEHPGV